LVVRMQVSSDIALLHRSPGEAVHLKRLSGESPGR
jgi:hypothetical protein